jgi:hypothetical protein
MMPAIIDEGAMLLAAWAVMALGIFFVAESRARSGRLWSFLAFVMSPPIAFLILVAAESGGRKRCPDCAELAQPDAKVCPHCQNVFPVAAHGERHGSG